MIYLRSVAWCILPWPADSITTYLLLAWGFNVVKCFQIESIFSSSWKPATPQQCHCFNHGNADSCCLVWTDFLLTTEDGQTQLSLSPSNICRSWKMWFLGLLIRAEKSDLWCSGLVTTSSWLFFSTSSWRYNENRNISCNRWASFILEHQIPRRSHHDFLQYGLW